MSNQSLTSIRIQARGSDGQMFSYAVDDVPDDQLVVWFEDAVETMRDREATWYPEETFRDDERAMFAWKHLGWGVRQPVNREQTAQEA